jgi:hypothetical protein
MVSDLLFRLRALFRRKIVERELEDEVRLHFELQVDKYLQSGLTLQKAVRRAKLEFRGIEQIKEKCRDVRGIGLVEAFVRDVRFGFRTLRRSPVFTITALLALALGIGANTAMFSVINALLIRPYRFPQPDRIIAVSARHISGKVEGAGYRDSLDWREQNKVFEEMTIITDAMEGSLTGRGEPQRIHGALVTHGFLRVLGIQPALGRFFTAEEDRPGAPEVAVLSHAAWQRYFDASRDVLGQKMIYNSTPFTIIGVLPPGVALPGIGTCEFYSPLRESPARDRFQHQYNVLARLKPYISLESAQANMTAIARRLELEYPRTNNGWGVQVAHARDALVLAFTFIVSVATGIVFGWAPAIYGSKADLNSVIKRSTGLTNRSLARGRFMSGLIICEVALSMILLISAGLLAKGLLHAFSIPTGLKTENVLTFALDPPLSKYYFTQSRMPLYLRLMERLRHTPDVEVVAAVSDPPMTQFFRGHKFQIGGHPLSVEWVNEKGVYDPSWAENMVQYNGSAPGFFQTLSIPLLQGRDFDERDNDTSAPVAIINDALRRKFFADKDPIGVKFLDAYDNKWRTIVGVVGSYQHQQPMNPPMPMVFRPLTQTEFGYPKITIKTSGDLRKLTGSIRGIVRSIDPDVTVLQLLPMQEVLADSLLQSRMMARFLGGFAGFALLLAAIGIYGIVAYSVRQRLHEIGVRMALGASQSDVVSLALRKGVLLSIIGIALGIPIALLASRILKSWLLGIAPQDLTVFLLMPGLLVMVSLFASYLPARLAANVDPIAVLRSE